MSAIKNISYSIELESIRMIGQLGWEEGFRINISVHSRLIFDSFIFYRQFSQRWRAKRLKEDKEISVARRFDNNLFRDLVRAQQPLQDLTWFNPPVGEINLSRRFDSVLTASNFLNLVRREKSRER